MVRRGRSVMLVVVTVFWHAVSLGATLLWNANTEPDLAGYHIYRCSQLPCTKGSVGAFLLTTVGRTTTSFNIGTPAVVQHYVVTAFDTAGNESSESNIATYTPPTASPPPPPPPSPPTSEPPVAPAPPPPPGGLRIVTAVSVP